MNSLELRMMQNPDRSRYLEVRLTSALKRGLVVAVRVADRGSAARTEQAVLAAGGALAEHLGFKYGENVSSDEVARLAREAYREMLAEARLN